MNKCFYGKKHFLLRDIILGNDEDGVAIEVLMENIFCEISLKNIYSGHIA